MPEQCAQSGQVTDNPSLHIVSLIVHVRPQQLASVSHWMHERPDLEIHLGNEEGKLVVVVETPDQFQINEIIEAIKDRAGVLNVAMVYHEELTLADADDVLVEAAAAATVEQPVKIVGEG
ncbi:chaperone NapD [Microbulbifer sp.]|uniref:chaperone NapD n=1 Tax=Microbulbifer sp. TaxID=1908541 RepID=UPI002F9437AE